MNRIEFPTSMASVLICLCVATVARASIMLTDQDFYGTQSGYITEYSPQGLPLGILVIGGDLRGLAFGPDHLLYVVSADNIDTGSGFTVNAIDSQGDVHASYYYAHSYLQGNSFLGKISFDATGHFYVGGQAGLVRFDVGNTDSATLIVNEGSLGIMDVKPLPNGDLLLINDYNMYETTSDGAFVRNYIPGQGGHFEHLHGIEYEPTTNRIFATEWGDSGTPDRLMKLDGSSGTLIANSTFTHGNDIVLAEDGRLVVTSWTESPRAFSQDLSTVTYFPGKPYFITQDVVPEPAMAGVVVVASLFLRIRRRTLLALG